jgi:peroxiredoxin
VIKHFAFMSIAVALAICTACTQSSPSKSGPIAPTQPARAPGVAIGDPAPDFDNLTGTDDQSHSLSDYRQAKAMVIVFTCNRCPVAQAYEDRLVKIADDYKDKGVQLVAINVNNDEDDKLPAMKQRAAAKGFNFPYLYDPSQASARAYGATVTPHVFLLDQSHTVAYMGAIDDNQDASQVSQNYLRDALDAVLTGDQPAVNTTQQFGCGIAYE